MLKRSLALVFICLMLVFSISCSKKSAEVVTPVAAQSGAKASVATTPAKPTYPTKDITFIIPFNAGGGIDIAGRLFITELKNYIKESNLVPKNIAGASGTVGADTLFHAKPDGYTLLVAGSGYPVSYLLKKFDKTYQDFLPVAQFSKSQIGFYVKGDAPYNTMEELVSYAKANPGALKIGVSNGTLLHIATLAIEKFNGITFKHIDIGGTTAKPPELISGRIDGYIAALSEGTPYIKSGDFKVLGVFGDTRSIVAPEVPTFQEMGYPYLFEQTNGIWAPADTSQEIIDYLNEAMEIVCSNPTFIANLEKQNLMVDFKNSKEYKEVLKKSFEECESAYSDL